jgi:4-diphosphocytidyl-2-C-methyl-D-erythritol kinase
VIVFPNGKINLGLNIVEKRPDGYHNLETLFYPVGVKDVLEIIPSPSFECKFYGEPIDGEAENNLCVKAYRLLKNGYPHLPLLKIGLLKNIPLGSGLGGGSADGAFTLRLLNELFHLDISQAQLIQYAVQLGSDCPFFVLNKPCFASGRGEILEQANISLEHLHIVLVHPGISVSTAWAFSNIKPSTPVKPIRKIVLQPVGTWRNQLLNDFEAPVFAKYPQLKEIKEKLYALGAVYASMSGSGSSLFGLFTIKDSQKEALTKKLNAYGRVTVANR